MTRYRTIVADPPWQYAATNPTIRTGTAPSTAEAHYQTMTNAEIAALPVKDLVADDAHLYLWVTNPRLFGERRTRETAPLDILEAWGFRYVTMLTWVKGSSGAGMGYYFRGDTEHVLFGVRGDAAIAPERRESNVLIAPRGRHSAKPDCFYDRVERVSPAPRLELFARRARFGWAYWGDESLGTAEVAA